ncbi:hypothetical protein BH09ACT10_BH09ACT10_24260 [soil metagenome]
MYRRVGAVVAALIVSACIATNSVEASTNGLGRISIRDGTITSACASHPYEYRLVPPSSDWSLEVELVNPSGDLAGNAMMYAPEQASNGRGSFVLCGATDAPGRYLLRSTLDWRDARGKSHREDLQSTQFTLKASKAVRVAGAHSATTVWTERGLRAAWANVHTRSIVLGKDIFLRSCSRGDPIRESPVPIVVDGAGHTVRQTCFENRLLRQDGTGFVLLKNITLTRGGSDGPGGAVTTRGEIRIEDSQIAQNLAEEPGGGVFSMRRATIVRSRLVGNLANDDGGAVYARRGGVLVVDSILNSNLVDGSGGAIGSTGDIVVVRSRVDGNTTDGDGGAIYADEDGDVTVIESSVSGNDADGPGGAIFTLDGEVYVVGSEINGNRADDRGGAISGESDVILINSTIARNEAIAHVAGGVWSRGSADVINSTISNNYAEGQGGGILAAGRLTMTFATVVDNVASVAGNAGAGLELRSFGSIIGPARAAIDGSQVQATTKNCAAPVNTSRGYNLVSDRSCKLSAPTDQEAVTTPALGLLGDNGGLGETRIPVAGTPGLNRIPVMLCDLKGVLDPFKNDHHLAGWVDFSRLALRDQRGVVRPQGSACDIGAVERTVP